MKTKLTTSKELADTCWRAMAAAVAEEHGTNIADDLIAHAAHEVESAGIPSEGGHAMRAIAEEIWKEGFLACLRAQEHGAFSRVQDN